jgi:hypothetical protein
MVCQKRANVQGHDEAKHCPLTYYPLFSFSTDQFKVCRIYSKVLENFVLNMQVRFILDDVRMCTQVLDSAWTYPITRVFRLVSSQSASVALDRGIMAETYVFAERAVNKNGGWCF